MQAMARTSRPDSKRVADALSIVSSQGIGVKPGSAGGGPASYDKLPLWRFRSPAIEFAILL
jgi:hypothetical protein